MTNAMDLSEIKEAIAKLSPEDRRSLTRSFLRTRLRLTPEERSRIRELVDATPEDQWVDWEDLNQNNSLPALSIAPRRLLGLNEGGFGPKVAP